MSQQLAQVYQHTVQLCQSVKLNEPKTIKYVYSAANDDLSEVKSEDIDNEVVYNEDVKVTVVNQDTIEAALDLYDTAKTVPLVLNMASDFKPGGGVVNGSKAQEEDLFRRTDYHRHLNNKLISYPLGPLDIVYTPGVTILKDAEYNKMRKYVSPLCVDSPDSRSSLRCGHSAAVSLDFVAVAGLRKPKLFGGKLRAEDEKLLRMKIRSIYKLGIKTGHNTLVLGALGCGAFQNPPEEVARLFKEEMVEFKRSFKQIVFAVLCPKDKYNFEVFQKTFTQDVRRMYFDT